MSSRFQVTKYKTSKGFEFAIKEVFMDAGDIVGVNSKAAVLVSDSMDGLRGLVDRISFAIDEYPVYNEEEEDVDIVYRENFEEETTDERVMDLVDIYGDR